MTEPAAFYAARRRATAILVLLAAVLVASIYSYPRARPLGAAPARGEDDVSMYTQIVNRLSAGESYYEVLGAELRQRGYPTRPFFNWRTPLLFSALARAPRIARVVLIGLALLVLAATVTELAPESPLVVLGGAIAQAGAIPIAFVPGSVVLHEVWTGALIAASVCLYLRRAWIPAALLGILALFVRELAAPFCVVSGVLAIHAKRWREVAVWTGGAAVYAVYLAAHVLQVHAHGQPGDLAHLESWIRWGGLHFILSTLRWNGWLTLAPAWAAAVALVVLLAGIFDRSLSPHLRYAVGAYLVFFAVAGQPFNSYWGVIPLMTCPLLFGYGLRSVDRLVRVAAGWA